MRRCIDPSPKFASLRLQISTLPQGEGRIPIAGGAMGDGQVKGGVKTVLQLEGLALLGAAVFAYSVFGVGWKWFAIFFLAPDLSFIFFLFGPRIGAMAYNSVHSTIGGLAVLAAAYLTHQPLLPAIGLIWLAHVGFDRALGYGLKYKTGFGDPHLGRSGRRKEATAAA